MPLTRAQIDSEINRILKTNNNREITAALHRTLYKLLHRQWYNIADDYINQLRINGLEALETPVKTDLVAAINSIMDLVGEGATAYILPPVASIFAMSAIPSGDLTGKDGWVIKAGGEWFYYNATSVETVDNDRVFTATAGRFIAFVPKDLYRFETLALANAYFTANASRKKPGKLVNIYNDPGESYQVDENSFTAPGLPRVEKNGLIYMVSEWAIIVYNTTNGTVTTPIAVGATDNTFNQEAVLYGDTIYICNANGIALFDIITNTVTGSVTGLASSASIFKGIEVGGKLYFLDAGDYKLYVVKPSTNAVITSIQLNPNPVDIVKSTNSQYVYVSCASSAHQIFKVSVADQTFAAITLSGEPTTLAVSGGKLWVQFFDPTVEIKAYSESALSVAVATIATGAISGYSANYVYVNGGPFVGTENTIKLINTTTNAITATHTISTSEAIYSDTKPTFHNGKAYFFGNPEGMRVIDDTTGALLYQDAETAFPIQEDAFVVDGLFYGISQDGTLFLKLYIDSLTALYKIANDLSYVRVEAKQRGVSVSPSTGSGYDDTAIKEDIELLNQLVEQLGEDISTTQGTETFALQNSLAVGDFYYKSNDTTYVKASPALASTANIRGIIIYINGGVCTGALSGKTLTATEISALSAAGVSVNSYQPFYLGNTGKPTLSPDTTPGAFTKLAIVQGTLTDSLALQNGLEDEVQVVFTATGTLTILEYARATTVVVNSASPVSITIAAITTAEDNKRVIFSNIGAGTLTVVNSVSGTANRTVATNASLRIFAYNSGWYLA